MSERQQYYRGCLVGLAVGDALGTTVEFQARGSFTPMVDLVGGGVFRLKAGQWTDDTSMALCLAASLIECDEFNAYDQMNRYLRWWKEGYMSSNGRCFDIGVTVSEALNQFLHTQDPFSGSTHPLAAGNGSLMRLAPIALYYSDIKDLIHYAAESSRTTHGAKECLDACCYYATLLNQALLGKTKQQILSTTLYQPITSKVAAIGQQEYRGKSVDEIKGSGYVVDCLEAALWCFYHTDSYAAAVLAAANLGDDADTTAAVCGQIAGAYYGLDNIPQQWRQCLVMYDEIVAMADKLSA